MRRFERLSETTAYGRRRRFDLCVSRDRSRRQTAPAYDREKHRCTTRLRVAEPLILFAHNFPKERLARHTDRRVQFKVVLLPLAHVNHRIHSVRNNHRAPCHVMKSGVRVSSDNVSRANFASTQPSDVVRVSIPGNRPPPGPHASIHVPDAPKRSSRSQSPWCSQLSPCEASRNHERFIALGQRWRRRRAAVPACRRPEWISRRSQVKVSSARRALNLDPGAYVKPKAVLFSPTRYAAILTAHVVGTRVDRCLVERERNTQAQRTWTCAFSVTALV